MRRTPIAAAALASGLGGTIAPVAAQVAGPEDFLEGLLRESARSSDLGNAFQALSIFTATPGSARRPTRSGRTGRRRWT